MYPILATPGGFPLYAYGIVGAVGFLVVAFLSLRRTRALGLDDNAVVDVMFWTAIAALAASRALYVLQNPDGFSSLGEMLNFRSGGLVFYGALVPGMLVGALLARRRGLPYWRLMDAFATTLPLGHAFARVGCFLAGCCWGTPTDAAWGVTYHHPLAPGPHGVALHPVQAYEASALIAIFVATNAFYARRRFDGQVMLLYLLAYAAVRVVTEAFRGDGSRGPFLEAVFGDAVSFSQGTSVLVAVAALAVFLWGARRASRQREIGASIDGPTR